MKDSNKTMSSITKSLYIHKKFLPLGYNSMCGNTIYLNSGICLKIKVIFPFKYSIFWKRLSPICFTWFWCLYLLVCFISNSKFQMSVLWLPGLKRPSLLSCLNYISIKISVSKSLQKILTEDWKVTFLHLLQCAKNQKYRT